MPETKMLTIPSLTEYVLLGRSGLRVSPLCLGTMTLGTEWGCGSPAKTARQILDRYLEAGGNLGPVRGHGEVGTLDLQPRPLRRGGAGRGQDRGEEGERRARLDGWPHVS
jgi:hypothetical protein